MVSSVGSPVGQKTSSSCTLSGSVVEEKEGEEGTAGYVRKTPDSCRKTRAVETSSEKSARRASISGVAAEVDDDGEESGVSESIKKAQGLAEAEVAKIEARSQDNSNEEENSINVIPRLLQGAPDVNQLVAKTQEYKAKGQQLDLLLLKAETYSHFIRENQERSKKKLEDGAHFSVDDEAETTSSKKRKRKAEGEDDSKDTFRVTKTLVGGTLMPYQKEGLKWLLSLWENGLSGILADEMGLGKTIQIIALIAQLRASGTSGPFIIVGPLATLPNWINEFEKWLPSCPVVLYHGSKADRQRLRQTRLKPRNCKELSFPVVVTSFEICMIDRPMLEKYAWQYMILDEGHRIKNRSCRLVKDLKQIPSTSRLLLTGTPIQNTLDELWSLLNFVNPMIFDDLEVFQSWFGFRNIGKETQVDDILGDEQQTRVVSKLHEILRPFLLRRMKRDVLSFIPLKKEIVIYCGMSSLQKLYYEKVLDNSIRETLVSMNIEGANAISQINQLMNLRKVSNHPFLFGEPRDSKTGQYLGEANPKLLIMASGKLKLLDRMLPALKEQKRKVLLFSQMTQMLDILQDYLHHKDYQCCRLDGTTKLADRQESIDSFNRDEEMFCFLISTKAGGLGINLTAADTCIIFDSDWNPHQDLQAQDRCHRIGQTKNVVVYRLLTAGTVEIEMLQKQISKKKLDRMTIHGGDFCQAGKRRSTQLTLPYLRQLLEDDVRNLNRMMINGSCSNEELASNGDIPDEELQCLLDKERIFATVSDCSDDKVKPVPPEGSMYDIVSPQESNLQAVA